jgi:hypothetical protein
MKLTFKNSKELATRVIERLKFYPKDQSEEELIRSSTHTINIFLQEKEPITNDNKVFCKDCQYLKCAEYRNLCTCEEAKVFKLNTPLGPVCDISIENINKRNNCKHYKKKVSILTKIINSFRKGKK